MPKVSILLAAYRHQAFVQEAITSVINQTFNDWELIVVDDCSPDKTAEVIQTVCQRLQDPRLRFEPNTQNEGQFASVQKAMALARGDYIAILNSDDAFLPEKLAKQVAFLEAHPDIEAVFCPPQLIDEHSKPFVNQQHSLSQKFTTENYSPAGWLRRFFMQGNALCHPSVLIRTRAHKGPQAIGPYNPCFAQLADFDFWVRLCFRHTIHVLPEPLVQFRVRDAEKNTGARTVSSMKQVLWEYPQVLRHYLQIASWTDLLAIFGPDFESSGWRFSRLEKPLLQSMTVKQLHAMPESLLPVLLALLALSQNTKRHDAFALSVLYEQLADPATAALAEQHLRLKPAHVLQLVRYSDPFFVESRFTLERLQRSSWYRVLKKFL